MSELIQAQTKDYIQALLETDELKAYSRVFKEFDDDNEAKKLLSDYREMMQTYIVFRQAGFDGSDELAEKLMEMEAKIYSNPKIQSLLNAQKDLQAFVSNLVREISQGINFPFAEPPRGGCCG